MSIGAIIFSQIHKVKRTIINYISVNTTYFLIQKKFPGLHPIEFCNTLDISQIILGNTTICTDYEL